MKRSGFTLLETVVALAIGVIVMGAALTANRAVQHNAQIAEQTAQEDAIINDTIDQLTMTSNATRINGVNLSTAFAGLGSNSPVRVAPYRFRQQSPLNPTDPMVIRWCTPTDASCTGLLEIPSPSTTIGDYSLGTALAANGAEVIAVRRTTPVSNEPQVYDFTYLPASTAVAGSTLFADDATAQTNWDFFRRQVTVTNQTLPYPSYLATITVWPMVAGNNRQLESVTRTVIFTDY